MGAKGRHRLQLAAVAAGALLLLLGAGRVLLDSGPAGPAVVGLVPTPAGPAVPGREDLAPPVEGARLGPAAGLAARGDEQVVAEEAPEAEPDAEGDPEEVAPGVLVGRVQDPSGAPVAGATVEAWGGSRRRRGGARVAAETDALGQFRIEVTPGFYAVWSEAAGFARSERARARVASGEAAEVALVLRVSNDLRGSVTTADGRPLPGAEVRVRRGRGEGATSTTDGQGRFELAGLPEGVYEVTASAAGYVSRTEEQVPVAAGRGGEVDFALELGARLEGRLTLPQGGPAARAMVFVYRDGERLGAATADEQGSFALDGLAAGPAEVFARSRDYAACTRLALELRAGGLTVQDLPLQEGPRIAGALRDPRGEPLEGLAVRAEGLDGDVRRDARSDAEGRYEVEHLYPGRYRLQVFRRRGGFSPLVEVEVDVAAGRVEHDLTVPDGAAVAGSVVGPDGQPVRGAWVFAIVDEDYRGRDRTDDGGAFEIRSLPAGEYRIFVRTGEDALVAVREVALDADARLEGLELQARAPARLAGRVLDAQGQPLPGVQLSVRGASSPVTRWATTGPDGAFQVEPLYDGAYVVEVREDSLALLARKFGAAEARFEPVSFTVRDQRDVRRDLVVRVVP